MPEVSAPMLVSVNHRTATRLLTLIIAALLLAQLTGRIAAIYLDRDTIHGLVPLFNMDEERNLPTFYSALAILCSAALAAIVARVRYRSGRGDFRRWTLLGVLFLVMTYDELFELHERLTPPTRDLLELAPATYFAWTIPMAILVAATVAVFLPMVRRLPRPVRRLVLLAGAIYVTGAMGMEILGGLLDRDPHNVIRALVVTLEETLEMIGIMVLIRALLLYLEHLAVTLRFGDAS